MPVSMFIGAPECYESIGSPSGPPASKHGLSAWGLQGYTCRHYPELLYSRYIKRNGQAGGDILTFDFGVLVCWGLTPLQEWKFQEVRAKLNRAMGVYGPWVSVGV